ncbi:glycosyltransferase family 4 protein [Microbacterium sp. HMH0099]|uniref:glycosyltransferase family 4 protein n=1 Tax=Microbacterium sp. HMH0099 TaxID=3414026 RepID=UPI003BF73A61
MSTAAPETVRAGTGAPRRRLAFVVSSVHGGGAEAVGVAWATWFADQGHQVAVVVVSDRPTGDVLPPRVTVHRLGGIRSHLKKVSALARLIDSEGFDALVGLQTYPNLLAIAARERARHRPGLVVTEHNLISLGLPGAPPAHRAKIALARRWYRRADVVTSASHPVAAEMNAAFGIPASRSLVVPNPAMAKVRERTPVPRVPGTAAGVQLVLACRLVPQKNPELALSVAEELVRRGIPTEVVSFGGGPLLAQMTAEAERRGVAFTSHGWVEDWIAHFGPTSVVLLPSHREGLGNVLIEAAARGVPSVAISTALGVADAIIPGVTGELAASADPAAVADAVQEAAGLEVGGIDDWLDRFGADASATLLEKAVTRAVVRSGSAVGEPRA